VLGEPPALRASSGRRWRRRGEKAVSFSFFYVAACCQALLRIFSPLTLFERCILSPRSVWRLPVALRPRVSNDLLSVRAPMPTTRFSRRLSTSTGRPVGGAPLSPTASWQGPEKTPGRLHPHQGRSLTQPQGPPSASLSMAPSGRPPVSLKRQRAMSTWRATATRPMHLHRLPPLP
jgi:hypothetical protein